MYAYIYLLVLVIARVLVLVSVLVLEPEPVPALVPVHAAGRAAATVVTAVAAVPVKRIISQATKLLPLFPILITQTATLTHDQS